MVLLLLLLLPASSAATLNTGGVQSAGPQERNGATDDACARALQALEAIQALQPVILCSASSLQPHLNELQTAVHALCPLPGNIANAAADAAVDAADAAVDAAVDAADDAADDGETVVDVSTDHHAGFSGPQEPQRTIHARLRRNTNSSSTTTLSPAADPTTATSTTTTAAITTDTQSSSSAAPATATTVTATTVTAVTTTTTTTSAPSLRQFSCTIRLLLLGRCRLNSPREPGRPFNLAFNSPDRPASDTITPAATAASALRDLVALYQPRDVIFRRTIFSADMEWVLNNADWSSVETLRIDGLVATSFSLNTLNHFPNLRVLNIGSNHINGLATTLPRDATPFMGAHKLEVLDARNNSLFHLPPALFQGMSSLRVLNLTDNYITSLEAGVLRDATALEHLWLSLNYITAIHPDALQGLSMLRDLTLEDNHLSTLEEPVFRDLTRLERLILSDNVINALPPRLLQHTVNLRQFEVVDSFLPSLPDTFFQTTTRMERLLLFNARLTALPRALLHNMPALDYFSISGNRVRSLHPDMFRGLRNITNIYINRNHITALPAGLFSDQPKLSVLGLGHNNIATVPSTAFEANTALVFLALSHNKLSALPASALRNKPQLQSLYLANNNIRRLSFADDDDDSSSNSGSGGGGTAPLTVLPALEILDLSFNPIEVLPPPHVMPNLTTLRAIHHSMSTIHMTPLLSLRRLTRLELASDLARPTSTLAFTAEEAEHDTAPPNLRFFDLRNVELSTAFVLFAYQQQLRLRHINLGWPGMSESTAPIAQICDLFDQEVEYVGLHNTAYRRIELCQDKRILSVGLEDNPRLEHLTLLHNLNRLNVSGCTSLRDMTLLSADILDISGTRLMFQPPLCDTWGTHVLLASRIRLSRKADLADVGAHIQRCLSQVDVLDLSQNTWLNQAHLVQTPPIVLSRAGFWSEDFAVALANNPRVPVLTINAGKVSCTLELGNTQARAREARADITTEVTFQFNCRCAQRFVQRDGKCVPDELTRGEIAAISMGVVMVVGAVLAVVYQHYRRRRLTLEVENKTVYSHLLEKEEEVMALKKVWEIDFGELHLVTRIDKDSEGAFGEVWLARWDELTVATKLLKRSVLLFDESQREEFEKEVEFLQRTRHPHVVRFFGAGTDPHGSPFLVLEFVAMGSLQALLRRDLAQVLLSKVKERQLSNTRALFVPSTSDDSSGQSTGARRSVAIAETHDTVVIRAREMHANAASTGPRAVWTLKLRLAQDIACGMAFVHSLGHVHRDLKSGNVLVSNALRAKISDFGCIRDVLTKGQTRTGDRKGHDFTSSSTSAVTATSATAIAPTASSPLNPSLTAGVGTPLYMAPEVLAGEEYDGKADVFSFGVLLWEIAVQRVPDLVEQELGPDFKGTYTARLLELLRQGKRLQFPSSAAAAGNTTSTDSPDAADMDATLAWLASVASECSAEDPARRPNFGGLELRLRSEVQQLTAASSHLDETRA
ncbi:TKL protein kinase [Salpingoeca rosetta]|uniref:TKL protein kinase n=1 Tax=Salpingoeca rosetta (strain ATCC 50818 / BSB-021) TaxID=946362 RepID=F2UTG4_SALR5|nr:TKL protein kinase [Salpingoeca rosetta]EGD83271.1 TKL protein kinase [Salpingoeca rosetta]|eukprot:XP_004987540.1 TKL protein kinase [Salpingoeca rosetta]